MGFHLDETPGKKISLTVLITSKLQLSLKILITAPLSNASLCDAAAANQQPRGYLQDAKDVESYPPTVAGKLFEGIKDIYGPLRQH